jgi:hypothetical protein
MTGRCWVGSVLVCSLFVIPWVGEIVVYAPFTKEVVRCQCMQRSNMYRGSYVIVETAANSWQLFKTTSIKYMNRRQTL